MRWVGQPGICRDAVKVGADGKHVLAARIENGARMREQGGALPLLAPIVRKKIRAEVEPDHPAAVCKRADLRVGQISCPILHGRRIGVARHKGPLQRRDFSKQPVAAVRDIGDHAQLRHAFRRGKAELRQTALPFARGGRNAPRAQSRIVRKIWKTRTCRRIPDESCHPHAALVQPLEFFQSRKGAALARKKSVDGVLANVGCAQHPVVSLPFAHGVILVRKKAKAGKAALADERGKALQQASARRQALRRDLKRAGCRERIAVQVAVPHFLLANRRASRAKSPGSLTQTMTFIFSSSCQMSSSTNTSTTPSVLKYARSAVITLEMPRVEP